jgi:hypothetical protein
MNRHTEPNPQDTAPVPRPLLDALREAFARYDPLIGRTADREGYERVADVFNSARAVVAAACQCKEFTPPPVSPSKDDKEARIAELEREVARLRELMTPAQEELDGIGITWQSRAKRMSQQLEQARAERDSLAAKVRAGLALADEWEALGRTFAHNSAWYESNLRTALSDPSADADECASCGEGTPRNECPGSKRPCGHHCNHSWEDSLCHWCGREFGEGGEATRACLCPEPPAAFGPNFIRCREALAGICPSVKPCDPPADAVTLPTTAERIAEVLAKHPSALERNCADDHLWQCLCGQIMDLSDSPLEARHRAHVADVLAALFDAGSQA